MQQWQAYDLQRVQPNKGQTIDHCITQVTQQGSLSQGKSHCKRDDRTNIM